MKKNVKKVTTNETTNETTNTKMEEIMEQAMVNVEVKGEPETTVQEEVKEKKVYRTFKEIIISKITTKAKGLPDYVIDPIIEQIGTGLNLLQEAIDAQKKRSRAEKSAARRLSKFTRKEIEEYLASLSVND